MSNWKIWIIIRKQQSRLTDVKKMISVDSTVLNYSTYYPGKMLGSTLSVSNMSDCEQIVELSVDAITESYQKLQIKERFPEASLPYALETTVDKAGRRIDSIDNSEHKH